MKKKAFIDVIFLILLVSTGLIAQNERFFLRSPKAMGMGGAGLAVLSQDHIFFYNPAQLNRLKRNRLTLIDSRLTFNKNLSDMIDFYNNNFDAIQSPNNFSDDKTTEFFGEATDATKKRTQVAYSGPMPINMVVRNFGAGLFNGVEVDYKMHTGASGIPLVNFAFQADFRVMVSAAYGTSNLLPGKLSYGGSVKYMYRWLCNKLQSVSDLDNELIVYSGKAIGVDLATLYTYKRWITGFTIFNINSPVVGYKVNTEAAFDSTNFLIAPDGKIEPSLRLGTAYYPAWERVPAFKNIVLALDIEQPFDGDITFFKKLYFGIEGSLVRVFKLRTGFAQGYPTFGLGINLSVLLIDYAFYGNELGHYAGQQANWNHLVRLQLGF